MQTIQLQIQDELYETISNKGININNTIQEFLYNLADDGFPAISTQEAKQRVSDAVNRYRDGTGTYANDDEYLEHKTNMIDSLKSKYENN